MPGIRWSLRISSTSSFCRISIASLPATRGQHAIAAVELVAQAVQHVRLVVDDQEGMPPLLHPVSSDRLDRVSAPSSSMSEPVAIAFRSSPSPQMILAGPPFFHEAVPSGRGGRTETARRHDLEPLNLGLEGRYARLSSLDFLRQVLALERGGLDPIKLGSGLADRRRAAPRAAKAFS